jgi:hypothetical protein
MKRLIYYMSSLFSLLFLTGCTTASGTSLTFSQMIQNLWTNNLLPIFNLSFLGLTGENAIMAFMRLIIVILVFTLFFEGTRLLRLPRNTGIIVALVIAIMTGLFIPGTILVAIGSSYGFIVALILLATPILFSLFLFSILPTEPVIWRWVRIILLIVVLYLLINIKTHALALI